MSWSIRPPSVGEVRNGVLKEVMDLSVVAERRPSSHLLSQELRSNQWHVSERPNGDMRNVRGGHLKFGDLC